MAYIIVIGLIAFCLIALIAEDFPQLGDWIRANMNQRGTKRNYNTNNYNNDTDMNDVYCPECGSPNVTVYRDGSCECEDCQFQFHIDYLR